MVVALLAGRHLISRSMKRMTAVPTPAIATASRLVLEQPGPVHLPIVVKSVLVDVEVVA